MVSFTVLRHEARGFTLIELLIAIVVVGILAALAFPTFMESIRKGRRSEAFAALAQIQQAQERWRGNHPDYASALANTAGAGNPPNGLGLPGSTSSGYYDLTLQDASATGYKATATAAAGKSQAADGSCVRLRVEMSGGNVSYGSATAGGNFDMSSTNPCWAK